MDAGVKLANVQAAELERYLLRLATTSRLAATSPCLQRDRPQTRYGEKTASCTQLQRQNHCGQLRIGWQPGQKTALRSSRDLGRPDPARRDPRTSAKFRVYAIYDPDYTTPWLLATHINLKAATVRAMYQELAVEEMRFGKQMLGAHRQFVHARESISACQRSPVGR